MNTFYFQDIIPDYETWKDYVSMYSIVNYENAIESEFDKYIYSILNRFFYNQNVRYNTPEDFIFALSLVYQNIFNDFLKQKELVDKIHSLTDDELLYLQETIQNAANNPNDEPTNPRAPLNFISAQTLGLVKGNKFKIYLEALNSMPSLNIFKLINGDKDSLNFKDLFVQILPDNDYIYRKGE